jgi:hypothetical protein
MESAKLSPTVATLIAGHGLPIKNSGRQHTIGALRAHLSLIAVASALARHYDSVALGIGQDVYSKQAAISRR